MRFLSVCSGIEAASCAWEPLGWKAHAFAEIEAFPSAVLAHHYPQTPNWGDMTKFQEWPDANIDVLVGGTPCQSFSVAGLRKGMADPRGNLALTFLAITAKYSPRYIVWENVPGVLSSGGGRDFGSFLGGLAECGYGWAYRVLDAQHFGVPQRRRRVFVVGHLGDWRRAAAVLFERHSLSGHPAPRREKGQGTAGKSARSVALRGREEGGTAELGDDVGHALRASSGGGDKPHILASTGDISHCLNAGGMGRQDYETETLIAHSLRGEGFDAGEDGTGRGTPLVPVSFTGGASDILTEENCAHPVTGRNGDPGMVCFTAKDHGADASDISPTLRSGSHSGSHANGGVMPAVAFAQNSRDEVRQFGGDGSTVGALAAEAGMKQQCYVAFNITPSNSNKDYNARESERAQALTAGGNRPSARGGDLIADTLTSNGDAHSGYRDEKGLIHHSSAVRRLTPRECERLQGFPDDYTLIPYRGKPAADGPRYKALGNSMAVPCMLWLGQRIQLVEDMTKEMRDAA
jgi:DNA (cytosine-5)-methyltransferase 1